MQNMAQQGIIKLPVEKSRWWHRDTVPFRLPPTPPSAVTRTMVEAMPPQAREAMYQLLRDAHENAQAEEDEVEHPTHDEARASFDPHEVAVNDPYFPGGRAVVVRSRAHADPDEDADRSKARRRECAQPAEEVSPVYSPSGEVREDVAGADAAGQPSGNAARNFHRWIYHINHYRPYFANCNFSNVKPA